MPKETDPQVNTQLLDALNLGEQLGEPPVRGENDLRDRYGYEMYPILDEAGAETSSVSSSWNIKVTAWSLLH